MLPGNCPSTDWAPFCCLLCFKISLKIVLLCEDFALFLRRYKIFYDPLTFPQSFCLISINFLAGKLLIFSTPLSTFSLVFNAIKLLEIGPWRTKIFTPKISLIKMLINSFGKWRSSLNVGKVEGGKRGCRNFKFWNFKFCNDSIHRVE